MMIYPHVQDRAQKELDLVVGRDRLPQFEDWSDLAYTSALVKEALRWKAVSPLGRNQSSPFSHDIIYEKFRCPSLYG